MQLEADSSVQLEADDMDLALPLVIDNNGEIHLQVYYDIVEKTNKKYKTNFSLSKFQSDL